MPELINTGNPSESIRPSRPSIFPILLVNFTGTLGYSIVLPFLVIVVLKLGGNAIVYGVLGATYSFFQLIGAPVLGAWSDRYGRKRMLLLSSAGTLAGWLVFLTALLLSRSNTSLHFFSGAVMISLPLMIIFFARALDGITGGNVSVANAYLADISTKAERKKNFGKMSASANLGLIFGPVISGLLGATAYGAILPIIAAALISVLAIIIIALKLKNIIPLPVHELINPERPSKLLGQEQKDCYQLNNQSPVRVSVFTLPNVRYFITLYFLIFLAFNFYYVAFPVFAAQELKWSVLQLGLFFSFLSGLLVLVQGPVLSWLSGKFASAMLVISGSLLLALAFAILRHPNMLLIYTGAVFFAVGNGIMWPSFLAIMSNIVSDEYQGTVQGYATSAGSLASIIGLLCGAFLYKALSSDIFLITTFLMVVIGISAYPMIFIERREGM